MLTAKFIGVQILRAYTVLTLSVSIFSASINFFSSGFCVLPTPLGTSPSSLPIDFCLSKGCLLVCSGVPGVFGVPGTPALLVASGVPGGVLTAVSERVLSLSDNTDTCL